MNSLFTLQYKKVFKNNLTLISLCLLLMISFSILYMNAKLANGDLSTKQELQGNIALQKKAILEDKIALKKYANNSDGYKITNKALKQTQIQLKSNQYLLNQINKNNWQPFYKSQLLKKSNNGLKSIDRDRLHEIKLRFSYLAKHPIPYENDAPTSGFQFILNLHEQYWPTLVTLVITFILVELYTSSYHNRLDSSSLLPLSNTKKLLTNTIVGWTVCLTISFVLNLLVFSATSLLFGTGNIKYPEIIHIVVKGKSVPAITLLIDLIPKTVILELLEFFFITILIQIVSKIFRRQLTTLFFTILLLLGLSLSTTVIVPLGKIAQWLPSTYLSSLEVVKGNTAFSLGNTNINFNSGLVTLISSSFLLLFFLVIIDHFLSAKKKNGGNI